MTEEKKFERIESYLQGKLSEDERSQFEQDLAKDQALKSELELHRSLHEEFTDDVLDLKSKLNSIASESPLKIEKSDSKRGMPLVYKIISIAAIFLLAIIFLPNLLNPSMNQDEIYASYYEPYPMALNQRSTSEDQQNVILNNAIQSYLDGNYAEASKSFNTLYAEDPNDIYLLYQASSKQANNELSAAIDLYDQVIANGDSKYTEQATWYKGLALLENGNKVEAKKVFTSIDASHYKSEQVQKILATFK